ncbi:cation channel sperm-associated protein 3 [Numida meleagris]|uniref:cation channel sperm-associated protein 3 n=1 Tax=Numida meleagris TaxID=8996 RepID=UPI000B3DBB7C|nr:cation channel sperm-associated protein 3 [Numida meleagris]
MDPISYRRSGHGILGTSTLIIAFYLYIHTMVSAMGSDLEEVTKALQSVRIFKVLKYSEGMKSSIKSLIWMLHRVMYALFLLFFLMPVFAILGHSLYGDHESRDATDWFQFTSATFSVFNLMTVDGWMQLREEMDGYRLKHCLLFNVTIIFLGYFIFFGLHSGGRELLQSGAGGRCLSQKTRGPERAEEGQEQRHRPAENPSV